MSLSSQSTLLTQPADTDRFLQFAAPLNLVTMLESAEVGSDCATSPSPIRVGGTEAMEHQNMVTPTSERVPPPTTVEAPPEGSILKKAIDSVYHYHQKAVITKMSSHGDDVGYTYAEFTRGSAQYIIEQCVLHAGIGKDDVFLDLGSGFATFMLHFAQVVGCRSWGIEIVANRCSAAASCFLRALDDHDRIGALVNTKIAFVAADIYHFDSFGPTTIVHSYDEVFDDGLILHIILTSLRTSTLKYLTSTKAARNPSIRQMYEMYGFRVVVQLKARKEGSGKSNTIYLLLSTWHSLHPGARSLYPCHNVRFRLSEEAYTKEFLEPGWSGEVNTLRSIFQKMIEDIERKVHRPETHHQFMNEKMIDLWVNHAVSHLLDISDLEDMKKNKADRVAWISWNGEKNTGIFPDNCYLHYYNGPRGQTVQELLDRGTLPRGSKLTEAMKFQLRDFFDVCSYACFTWDKDPDVVFSNPCFNDQPSLSSRQLHQKHHRALYLVQMHAKRFNPVLGVVDIK
jgi:hypothetical protein